MPNTAQAKKRLRQNGELRLVHQAQKSRIRTEIKKFYVALKENNRNHCEVQLRLATKLLDKAAKSNLIHPNNVARKKSKMARQLYELQHRHDNE